jgi:hypothetical protein
MGFSRPALHSGHRNRNQPIAIPDAANTIPPAHPRIGYRSDSGNTRFKKSPDRPARQPLTTPTIRTMSRRMSRRSRSILDRDFAMGNSLSLGIEFCQPASFTCQQKPPRPQSPHPSPGVQLTGGNRQIRTTPPPLARGVTPVIAWSPSGSLGVQPAVSEPRAPASGGGPGEMTATCRSCSPARPSAEQQYPRR